MVRTARWEYQPVCELTHTRSLDHNITPGYQRDAQAKLTHIKVVVPSRSRTIVEKKLAYFHCSKLPLSCPSTIFCVALLPEQRAKIHNAQIHIGLCCRSGS